MEMIFPNMRLTRCSPHFPPCKAVDNTLFLRFLPILNVWCEWMRMGGNTSSCGPEFHSLKTSVEAKCNVHSVPGFFFFHPQNHYNSYCLPQRDGMKMSSGATIHLKGIPLNVISVLNWRRWQPTPVLLPGKSHERRGLVGCSPWGR